MFLYVCLFVQRRSSDNINYQCLPHHELDGKVVAMGSLPTERTEFGFRLKPAASPSSVVCPSWRIWCVKSGITSCPVELRFGCFQDSWHLQPLGVQSELGSNILGQHHWSLQSMMDVYEEAISSLRNKAEKATESLLKNGTLDKSQTKCGQCNGLEISWKLWNWHGIDRFLEYCTCVNMAWCSSLRQRWIYNYGWWCELNNPFALPARPRITIGLWADNKSHRIGCFFIVL